MPSQARFQESASADAGLAEVLSQEQRGSLSPEKENTASWPVFWLEEVSHMAVPAKLDELHLRNMAESWADSAESGYGRRLLHNSGFYLLEITLCPAGKLDGSGPNGVEENGGRDICREVDGRKMVHLEI